MKPFPHLILLTLAAAVFAWPLSTAAAGLLLFTAAFGAIISIDYSQRYRGLRLPLRAVAPQAASKPRVCFRAPPLCVEPNRLAA